MAVRAMDIWRGVIQVFSPSSECSIACIPEEIFIMNIRGMQLSDSHSILDYIDLIHALL